MLSRGRLLAMLGAGAVGNGPAGAFAQASVTRRVALVCTPADDVSRPALSRFESRLSGALLRTGRFTLVDRSRLNRLLREQDFSNSAYADPHTAAKLGKLAGAERFLSAELTVATGLDRGGFVTTMTAHAGADFTLVDVSTGRVVSAGSADGEGQNKLSNGTDTVSTVALDDLSRQAIDACIDDLISQLSS